MSIYGSTRERREWCVRVSVRGARSRSATGDAMRCVRVVRERVLRPRRETETLDRERGREGARCVKQWLGRGECAPGLRCAVCDRCDRSEITTIRFTETKIYANKNTGTGLGTHHIVNQISIPILASDQARPHAPHVTVE